MTKFTQGPWTNDTDNCIYAGDEAVAMAFGFGAGKAYDHTPETAANARLIAAAPELLAALQHIASFTAYVDCDNCNEMNVVARAAIAKATGSAS